MSNSPRWLRGFTTWSVVIPLAGRPYARLFRSVAMVVALMRTNITQEFAGAVFGAVLH
jgi:hypothetical protein